VYNTVAFYFRIRGRNRTMEQEYFDTPDELATALKVPKSWVYARTREIGPGSIPRIKVGKYLRFNRSEVLEWLKRKNEARQ
jgi:excisionase family DNA binding protein